MCNLCNEHRTSVEELLRLRKDETLNDYISRWVGVHPQSVCDGQLIMHSISAECCGWKLGQFVNNRIY